MYTCMREYLEGVGLYACTFTYTCVYLSSICECNSDKKPNTGALRTGFVRKSFPDCFSIAIVCESGNEYYLSAYNSHIINTLSR